MQQHITPGRFRAVIGAAVCAFGVAATAWMAHPARAASDDSRPEIQEHTLSNGMKLVLVPRHLSPTIAGGWVARVGSVNERPGITGISHLFEHMMSKGTHVIGTKDYKDDIRLISEQEAIREQMRAEITKLRDLQRRGEIDDITSPEAKTARYKELEMEFDALVAKQRENMVKNEFNNILQKNGGTLINAFTNTDMTVYFEQLPANKLELWFWLEADRLKNRVFREFYSERDVVYEERRMRYEATPKGPFLISLNSVFWDSSPYSWPTIGWPSDVANITLEQANDYYGLYYAPQNLTAVLVGDLDPEKTLEMAEKYLGSVPRGRDVPPEMITTETKQKAEKRFYAEGDMNPGVTIRWHTPAFVHKDIATLEVIAELLSGPTGRIQRNVVLDADIASSGGASQQARRYAGLFEIDAQAKDGRTPEQLEAALHAEIEKLKKEPVPADELQSVKNRYLTDTYRALNNNFQIMLRYLVAEGFGDLHGAARVEAEVQDVTAEQVIEVANRYLTRENRTVATWKRADGTEPEDPVLASLPAQAKPMVKQALAQIEQTEDPEKLQQMLAQMGQMEGQVPAEMKPALDYIKDKIEARIALLSESK